MPNNLNLNISPEDRAVIHLIVRRAVKAARETKLDVDPISLALDLTATHLNGNPLALKALLHGPEFSFRHDVFGIMRNIDRRTGKLGNHFSPRYTIQG